MKIQSKEYKYFSEIEQNEGVNEPAYNPCKILGMSIICLNNGNFYDGKIEDREALLVILSGSCTVEVNEKRYENIGERTNVFNGKPYSVFIPPKNSFKITVASNQRTEIAICTALSSEKSEPFLITPNQVNEVKGGALNFSRKIHQILVNTEQHVSKLIIGETLIPSGNWSSFPPHRHAKDNLPEEVFMEEIYFFKVFPKDGFGFANYYSEENNIEEVAKVKNNSVMFMPEGYYHTHVSAPGCQTYYIWALAGNHRKVSPVEDPKLSWVSKSIPMLKKTQEN